jgi:DNA-binding PadR family transcriptional regulator
MKEMKHTNEFEAGHEVRQEADAVRTPTHEGKEMHGSHGRGHAEHGRGGFGHGADHHGHGPGRLEHAHGGAHVGGRARRGETRYVLLDALVSGPKHGYEIVKALEERSAGQYVPSPGTVYPTMQFLQDEGMVTAIQDGDRRVFQLTDAGKAELEAHAAEVEGFWARFQARGVAQASEHEVAFLEEELESLKRTIWGGLGDAIERGDQEMIRRVRQAVEGCRNDVRNVIKGEK